MNTFCLFLALASIGLAITDAKPVEGKKPGKKSAPVSATEPKSISVTSSSSFMSTALPEGFDKLSPEVEKQILNLLANNGRTATSKVPPQAKSATKSEPPAKPEEGKKPGKNSALASEPEPEMIIVEESRHMSSNSGSNNGNKDNRPSITFPDGFDKLPPAEKESYLKIIAAAMGRTSTSKVSSPPNNPEEPKPVQKGRTAMSNIKAKPMEVTTKERKSAPVSKTEPSTSSSSTAITLPDGYDKWGPDERKHFLNLIDEALGRTATSKIPPPAKTATKSAPPAKPEEGKKPGKKSAPISEPEAGEITTIVEEHTSSNSGSNNGKKDNGPLTLPEGFDKLSPEEKKQILNVLAAVNGRAAMSKASSPPNNPASASTAGEVVDEAEQKERAQAWAKLKVALETYLQKRGKGGQQGRGVIISTTAPKIQGRRASAPVKKDASTKVIQATNRGFHKKKP